MVNSGQYCKTESPETETCLCFFYSSVYLWSIVVNSANSNPAKTRRANLPAAGRFAHGQKKDFHKNNCQFVPVCAGLCRFLPAGFCRFLPVSAGFCRFLPVSAGLCWFVPRDSLPVFFTSQQLAQPLFLKVEKIAGKNGGQLVSKEPPFPPKKICFWFLPGVIELYLGYFFATPNHKNFSISNTLLYANALLRI